MKMSRRAVGIWVACALLLSGMSVYPNGEETDEVSSVSVVPQVQTEANLTTSVANGLLAHLKLDGDVTDETENSTPQLVGSATYETGISGQAIRFSGERGKTNSNRIKIADNANLKFTADSTYTAGIWLKAQSTIPDSNIMGTKSWNKASNPGWCLAVNSSGSGRFRFAPVSGTGPEYVYKAASGNTLFNNSQWIYVVVTRSAAGDGKVYINGSQVSAPASDVTSAADSGVSAGDFCIGADCLGQYGPGQLVAFDDVRIWNRVLSTEEIAYIYATTPALSKVTVSGVTRVDLSNGEDQTTTLSVQGTLASGGTVTPQDPVTWSCAADGVTVVPQGNGATAQIQVSKDCAPQTIDISVTCRGVSETVQLQVVKDPTAAKVVLSGKRAVLRVPGEIRETYSVTFQNQYGTTLTDISEVEWSVASTEGVTVTKQENPQTAIVTIPDDAETESVYTLRAEGAGLAASMSVRLISKGVIPANLTGKVENKLSFEENYAVDAGGTITPTISGGLTYADGVQGKAGIFTNGNYVDFGNYDLAGKTITMAFCSQDFTGVQDPAILANKDWNQANEKGFLFAYCYNQQSKFRSRVGNGSANETLTWDYQPGEWMTLAFAFEQDAYTVYMDGKPVERRPLSEWSSGWMNSEKYSLKLGNDGTGSYRFNSDSGSEYHFLVDNFTIYNSILTQNEMEEIAVVNTTETVRDEVVIHPLADVLDVDFSDGTVLDRSRYATEFVQAEGAVVEQDATLGRNVLSLSGAAATDVKYKVTAAQTNAISDTFTFETAFLVHEKKNQTIAGNTEVAGMSYEMNADGRVELWLRSEQANSYFSVDGVKPGFDVEIGQYYHAVTTYDGAQLKLYVNGKEVFSRAATLTVKHPAASDGVAFSIGADPKKNYADSVLMLNGKVARLGLYSTALTKKQVKEIYREFVTPETLELHHLAISGADTVAANLGTVHTYTLDFVAENGKYVRKTDRDKITWELGNAPSGVSIQGAADQTEAVQVKVDTKVADGATVNLKATYTGVVPALTVQKTIGITNDGTGENIKIAVLSDFQLKSTTSSTVTDNIKKALRSYKDKGVDVILVPGDMTDDASVAGYEKMWAAFDAVWPDKTTRPPIISCMGNHDYWNGRFQGKPNDLEAAKALYLEQMGVAGVHTHDVIKGYHFISISPEDDSTHGLFSETAVNFLKTAIAEAEADDPTKPIFVQAHQHVRKKTADGETPTVYLSDEWGNAALYDAMKEHPQIVFFSGHSHAPIDDERSIHQEDFTSIGTSSMNYLELETGKVGGTKPTGYNTRSQSLYLQVTPEQITVERWDKGAKMASRPDWVIARPVSKNQFTYTNEKRLASREAPKFAQNAKISVSNVTENTAKITLPAATHEDFVHSYRVEIKNRSNPTAEAVNYLYFSDFCKGVPNMGDTVSYTLSGLLCSSEYEVNVYAIESFGKESKPLTATIATAKGTIDPNDPKPTADVLNVTFESGTAVDQSTFATTLTPMKKGEATAVSYSWDDSINYMVMNCNDSALKAALNSTQRAKITNQYSMETVVKLDRVNQAQSIFANTESAGISLEITDTGRVELWARVGSAYQKAGEAENVILRAGQYYHLMATYNGTQLALYVDGQKVAVTNANGAITHKELPMYIGGDTNASGELQAPIAGKIAFARLYSIGLTEQQVTNHYNAYCANVSKVYPAAATLDGAETITVPQGETAQTATYTVAFQDAENRTVTVADTQNIVWHLEGAGTGVSMAKGSTGDTVTVSVTKEAVSQKVMLCAEYVVPNASQKKITVKKDIWVETVQAEKVEISGADTVAVSDALQTISYTAKALDADGNALDEATFAWNLVSSTASGVGLNAAGVLYVNASASAGEVVIEAVLQSDAEKKAQKTIAVTTKTVSAGGGVGGGRGNHTSSSAKPGAVVTPAQTEKLPQNTVVAGQNVPVDVPETHWARESIQTMLAQGLISGDETGRIRPDDNITREETIKVILAALHKKIEQPEGEIDANTSAWAKNAMLTAKMLRIVEGDENGHLNGKDEISRVEAMVMIARALGQGAGDPAILSAFTDEADIPAYAVNDIAKLVENGIVKGYADGSFGAGAKMTRAELFVMMMRITEG